MGDVSEDCQPEPADVGNIKVSDKLRRFLLPVNGLVAILDALGAKNYSEQELVRFLDSRDIVLEKLAERARPERSIRRAFRSSLSATQS